jgi:glycosyltransferase involved in cell wall biosynthesis
MPTYNTPKKMLLAAVESVINQYYPNWELIIVDDASSKETAEEIENLASFCHEI